MNFFFTESDVDDKLIEQIIRPPRQGYSMYDLGPEQKNIKGIQTIRKDFKIKNKKDLILHGSLYQPIDTNSTKLIIYLHGNAGCRMEASPMLNHLIPLNISVLAFDFSGCGMSEGKYVTLGCKEVDDLDSVMKYITQNYPQYQNIGLWGRSMGAVVSLMYAGQPSKYPLGSQKLTALILDSPFASFKKLAVDLADQKYGMSSMFISGGIDLVRKRVQTLTGEDLLQLKIFQFAQKCTQSAIFTYSPQDQLIHYSHSQLIMENYQGQKSKFTFKGDHNAFRDANYYKNIIQFIKHQFQIQQEIQPQQHLLKTHQSQFQQQKIYSPQNQRNQQQYSNQGHKQRQISQAPVMKNNFIDYQQPQQENKNMQQSRYTQETGQQQRSMSNFKLGGGQNKIQPQKHLQTQPQQQQLNQSQIIHQQFQMNPSHFSTYDASNPNQQLNQDQNQISYQSQRVALQPQTNYVNNQQNQQLNMSRQQQLSNNISPQKNLNNYNNNNNTTGTQKGISLLGVGRQIQDNKQENSNNNLYDSQMRTQTLQTQQSQPIINQNKKFQNYQVQTVNISLQKPQNIQQNPQQQQKVLQKQNSNLFQSYLVASPRAVKQQQQYQQQNPQQQIVQSRHIQLNNNQQQKQQQPQQQQQLLQYPQQIQSYPYQQIQSKQQYQQPQQQQQQQYTRPQNNIAFKQPLF